MKPLSALPNRWTEALVGAALFLFAFALRVGYSLNRSGVSDHDSASYVLRARDILAGGGVFDDFHVPVYPLLIVLWSFIVGDDISAARVAAQVSGALVAVVVFLIGRHLYGWTVGIVAGLLVALNASLIQVSSWELSESTYTLVLVLLLYRTLLAMKKGGAWRWAVVGGLVGTAYLTRPEGIVYLGLIPLAVWADHLIRTRRHFSPTLPRYGASFLLAGMVLCGMNVLQIHRELGVWTINGRTNWAALTQGVDQADTQAWEHALRSLTPDRQYVLYQAPADGSMMLTSYRADLSTTARDFAGQLAETYSLMPVIFPWVLMLFVGIGLMQLRFRREEGVPEIFLLAGLLPWAFVYPLYEIDFENLTPVVPVLCLWAGLGITAVVGRVAEAVEDGISFAPRRILVPVLLLGVVGFASAPEALKYLRVLIADQHPDEAAADPPLREFGAWMDENLPAGSVVMARQSFIAMYAGRRYAELPYAPYVDVLEYARLNGVDLLFLDERLRELRPELTFLFDTDAVPAELELVGSSVTDAGERLLLFQIRGAPVG